MTVSSTVLAMTQWKGREGSDLVVLGAFLAMVVGIGGNVIAIKYISRAGDLDPFWAAASRFLVASAFFALVARGLRAPMPGGRAFVGALLYGVSIGAFFAFAYWGLQGAPAGLASVFLATSPCSPFCSPSSTVRSDFAGGA